MESLKLTPKPAKELKKGHYYNAILQLVLDGSEETYKKETIRLPFRVDSICVMAEANGYDENFVESDLAYRDDKGALIYDGFDFDYDITFAGEEECYKEDNYLNNFEEITNTVEIAKAEKLFANWAECLSKMPDEPDCV